MSWALPLRKCNRVLFILKLQQYDDDKLKEAEKNNDNREMSKYKIENESAEKLMKELKENVRKTEKKVKRT